MYGPYNKAIAQGRCTGSKYFESLSHSPSLFSPKLAQAQAVLSMPSAVQGLNLGLVLGLRLLGLCTEAGLAGWGLGLDWDFGLKPSENPILLDRVRMGHI